MMSFLSCIGFIILAILVLFLICIFIITFFGLLCVVIAPLSLLFISVFGFLITSLSCIMGISMIFFSSIIMLLLFVVSLIATGLFPTPEAETEVPPPAQPAQTNTSAALAGLLGIPIIGILLYSMFT